MKSYFAFLGFDRLEEVPESQRKEQERKITLSLPVGPWSMPADRYSNIKNDNSIRSKIFT